MQINAGLGGFAPDCRPAKKCLWPVQSVPMICELGISIRSITLATGFVLVQQGHPDALISKGQITTISLLIFKAG
jgi:hypothetical protein